MKHPVTGRSTGNSDNFSGDLESMDSLIFGFLEENQDLLQSSYDSKNSSNDECFFEDDEGDDSTDSEESIAFWKSQKHLLETILSRRSTFESRIMKAIKEARIQLLLEGHHCNCQVPATGGCRNCMRQEISGRLREAGYNCNVCASKWMSSSDIPSGEHAYLEVMDKSSSHNPDKRVIIELNFRAEFEMGRSNEDFNDLIRVLPEVFVGRPEKLRTLIRVLCSSAKKCMKDQKMHLPPWRKQKYMQAKWSGRKYEEEKTLAPIFPIKQIVGHVPKKQRSSMLTTDLLENCTNNAIRVI